MSNFNNNNNKYIIFFTIIALILLVSIPTIYKVVKNHQNKQIAVVEKKVIEAGRLCQYKKECPNEEITLKELYDLKYLDKLVNPINKKVYDEDSTITITKQEIIVNLH